MTDLPLEKSCRAVPPLSGILELIIGACFHECQGQSCTHPESHGAPTAMTPDSLAPYTQAMRAHQEHVPMRPAAKDRGATISWPLLVVSPPQLHLRATGSRHKERGCYLLFIRGHTKRAIGSSPMTRCPSDWCSNNWVSEVSSKLTMPSPSGS